MLTPTQTRSVIAAAGAVICLAYFAGGARGIGTGDRDQVFSPADDPRMQVELPAAHVPVGAAPTVSALAARGSLAVALGRRSAIRDLAAVSTAAAAVAFAAMMIVTGVPLFPAVAAMLGLAFGSTFWSRGVAFSPDTLSPLLALVAIWAALRWRAQRRISMAALAVIAGVLAIADIAMPLIGRDFGAASSGIVLPLVREFGALGLLLVLAGIAAGVADPRRRTATVMVTFAAVAWHLASRSAVEPLTFPVVICGWAAIAVGLAWLRQAMPQRSGQLLFAAIAIVLVASPVLTRVRLSALGADNPSEQRARLASDFAVTEAPDGAMVIAESRRADTLIQLAARQAGRQITFVPQTVAHVSEALAANRPLFAFDNARANLEQHGFLFEPAHVGNTDLAVVAGQVPCAVLNADTFTDVSLLLANGSFVVHGAPQAAPPGVVIRLAAPVPVNVDSIEPRSIPFEIGDVAPDAEGVPELIALAGRGGGAEIASIRIPASGRVFPVAMKLTAAPAYALATSEEPVMATLCPGVQQSGIRLGGTPNETAAIQMNEAAPFGFGWHPEEADPDFFRWTGAPDASVRVSTVKPGVIRVTITATPAARPEQKPAIGLSVNTCRLDSQAMHAGQGDYEWLVEEGCWRAGANQLWLHTSPLISPAALFATHDSRLLGARVGAIRLTRAN